MQQKKKILSFLNDLHINNKKETFIKNIFLLISVTTAYSGLFIINYINNGKYIILCFFKKITGYNCFTCGLGRATVLLFKGDLLNSFKYHLLGIPINLLIIFSLIIIINDLIKGKSYFNDFLNKKHNFYLKIFILSIILLNWLYNYKN